MQLCTSLLLSLLPAASPFAPTSALSSFAQKDRFASPYTSRLSSSAPSDTGSDDFVAPSGSAVDQLESYKADLVSMCLASSKPGLEAVRRAVTDLEGQAEQAGLGQASTHSGLISGEWECIYSPEDLTRTSPFFWAFRRAFPDSSDQIFGITDAIPAPVKEVGPAYQTIDLDVSNDGRSASGTLVSRVKVATLGGLATSIMTTRTSVVGIDGLDGIRLKIESTKPEDSTILEKLGPLGEFVNTNGPPFPSGEALEKAQPGSSEVVMRTTFCDEGIRVSRNGDRFDEVFVWKRKAFGGADSVSV